MSSNWRRPAAVAGTFYPRDPGELREVLDAICAPDEAPRQPLAIVAPHAGYLYSGRIAGEVYRRTRVPRTAIVLCPNHTGLGKRIAVWEKGEWESPLGRVRVEEALARDLLTRLGLEAGNQDAHFVEHAVETHLPFLQYRNPEVTIVPVVLGLLRWEDVERVAAALADTASAHPGDVLLVASTDMSHFIPADEARQKDQLALECLLSRDPRGLYDTVRNESIGMCGFIPTAAVLAATNRMGASRAEVTAYGHSGEVTGDWSSVVAYASAWIF